ncbi:MAG: SpoIIE family protein phosphatase [Actinomycetota bacterium]
MSGEPTVTTMAGDPFRERLRQLGIVYEMALVVADAESPDLVYRQALDALIEAAGVDRAAILLIEDGVMRFKASRGLSQGYRQAVEGHSPWAVGTQDPAPVLVRDVASDPRLEPLRAAILGEGIRALAFIPLLHRGRLIGTFVLYLDAPHDFTDDELQIARVVASHVALGVERHRREQALERSTGHLELAFEMESMGSWEWDIGSGEVTWAPSLERVHGLEPGTFPGTFDAFRQEIDPDDLDEVLERIRRALEGEAPYEATYRARRPDGGLRWIAARGRVIRDGAGRPVRMIGVCADVTDRRARDEALAESEERFRTIFESSSEAILVVDTAADEIADANDAAARLLGYTRKALTRMRLSEVFPADHPRLQAHARGLGGQGRGWTDEVSWRTASGESLLTECSGSPMELGGRRLMVVCVRDIRHRRREEEALRLLAEASELLFSSLAFPKPLEALARLVVPRLGDWCAIHLVAQNGKVEQTTVAHVDPAMQALADELWNRHPPDPGSPMFGVLRTGRSELYAEITDEQLRAAVRRREELDIIRRLGLHSAMIVPLMARGKALGTMTLARSGSNAAYDAHDLAVAEGLGRRAGVATDNARLYQERSRVARTLQQRLLPPAMPVVKGLELAARYVPAAAEVGGDFYDVFPIGRGRWALALGDVCGKGVEAAALTGMIRYTLRAVAMQHHGPAAMLKALNGAVLPQLEDRQFCTMALATLEKTGGRVRITLACAGHPSPLKVSGAGVEPVGGAGSLVGVFPDLDVTERGVDLQAGEALVFFTDGATDQRAEDDVAALRAALEAAPAGSAAALAETVADVGSRMHNAARPDDVAVLVVKVS